jgi:uncharacterized membrane protein
MHFVLALVGALLGALLGIDGGFLIGALAGFFGALIWRQNKSISELQARLDELTGDRPQTPEPAVPASTPAPPAQRAGQVPPDQASSGEAVPVAANASRPEVTGSDHDWTPPPGKPSVLDERMRALGQAIVRFATTGNPVVRIGAVVLFIGVAYLMRYAYEHALVPVELRLAGAALGGVVLLGFGWRLREREDTYGLILQGVGLAILYLTVFAASRLYGLVPMGAAFGILVMLVAGASVLAVVQKSQALAIFSMSGGFLAPVLTSTGEGSHVALFSYYALLNAGILTMAWFRHWRWLNWTGFVFTFVIGASWGYQYYQPEYYASTQPFLILFFAFYLAVSMLFARRQTVELTGVVDGTLVFGTPVIAFALQAGLVKDVEFGLAYSALAAAATYALLGWWLKRQGRLADLLDQSFVALAVVFATLAIPFAFDNQRFTAATWALEGAGIYWVGVRQAQRLPRAFGTLLQLAAGFAFVSEIGRAVDDTLFLNSAYLGAAFLGIAGVFTASLIGRNRESLTRYEPALGVFLLAWGVIWWLSGGVRELSWYTPGEARFEATNLGEHLFLIYAAASAALVTFLAGRIRWREGLAPGFVLLPIAVLLLLDLDINWVRGTAFSDFGWLAWPVFFIVGYWHLGRLGEGNRFASLWHAFSWWFLTLFIAWNSAALVRMAGGFAAGSVWVYVVWGAVPLVGTLLVQKFESRDRWPFTAYPGAYFGWGWTMAVGYLGGWLLATGLVRGDAAPIPYVLLINPLELVQIGILLLGGRWLGHLSASAHPELERIGRIGLGALAFFWINTVIARAVHHYAGVPYPIERIVESDAFLTAVTIVWTVIALLLMGYATRRSVRGYWMVGAGLLAVVIAKLFLVDMGNLALIGRIVTFISVGVLMLVIGYFAPLPPKGDNGKEMETVRP